MKLFLTHASDDHPCIVNTLLSLLTLGAVLVAFGAVMLGFVLSLLVFSGLEVRRFGKEYRCLMGDRLPSGLRQS